MILIDNHGKITKFRLARTVLGRGLYFTAAYLVDGLLVDTGCAHTVKEFMAALEGSNIRSVVNTHTHEDHVAGNAQIQKQYDVPVFVHEKGLPVLANPRKVKLCPYQLVMWGYAQPSRAEPIGNILETERHQFQVIDTPGHSPDHICLYEPNEGWVFTGDAYIGGRDRSLRADYNIWQIIDSLKKLADLDISVLFPGSGSVRTKPASELREKIEYLEETGARVLELHKQGLSRRRICRTILGREIAIAYYTLGNFSGINLVRSYIDDTI